MVFHMSGKARVLVVNDFYISRHFTERIIQTSLKYSLAKGCQSPEQAIDFCRENQVDFVLMNASFHSGMDGLDACALIQEMQPSAKLVLVVGALDDELRKKAVEAGIAGVWEKRGTMRILHILDRISAGDRVFPE
jgi:DNA-binding NarL/FixJ family response regulator